MKIKAYIVSCLCLFTIFSCSKESTDNVSSVTIFPQINLLGNPIINLEQGKTFIDPGVNANINGVKTEHEVNSNLDSNKTGFYTINYSVKNTDGFEAKTSRTVIVYQNNNTIAGVYSGRRLDKGIESPILITSNTDGSFTCTDIAGGYYEQSTNQFGPAFGADAIINLDTTNNINSPGSVIDFGPIAMTNGRVSMDKKTLNWTVTLTDFDFSFDVELIKVTP